MAIYSTVITEIGPNAKEFLEEDMMVLFGDDAPEALRPYCFLIEQNVLENEIQLGYELFIDDEKYEITAVGNVVNKNLKDLGHITINFSGETVADLAGTLYVENKQVNAIKEGTTIKISEKAAAH
ncbi:phosphotransferase system glucitol/sorbitol-specific iia component [Trichococcus palustris]|jgi:glucitol/sorbitol PTS system EIIA component|uniref:Phosphotransferase system glucitol/sorbitol-specific iia component n=1 Tax=Trichococcus palustris TaxID=140314 RepID=A0A143Z2J2_9LACT|nr:PTS glucitol/sorbitol transporter subunit IIA [Trichococcus palustris]CZR02762.1 phosphotransferase system glucitol/sorbitol-specific iia component [Trichococcus palustris]SFL21462.1 PTS system, glucitol/sorbitol-specific IIA component [Trichococcus palustris]